MSESRHELLNWVSNLLEVTVTRVEQMGTGAYFCQIYDSIYGDVPLNKVKFNANTEYQYISNFKILQSTFTRRRIDKNIPLESLVKCKFQDNLLFLQWTKKFWDNNSSGAPYDAVARRKNNGLLPTQSATRPTSRTSTTRSVPRSAVGNGTTAQVKMLQNKVTNLENDVSTLNETVSSLEQERSFYFSKLREIEILVQSSLDTATAKQQQDTADGNLTEMIQVLESVQTILYSTEEGFELPIEDLAVQDNNNNNNNTEIPLDDDEPNHIIHNQNGITAGGEDDETF